MRIPAKPKNDTSRGSADGSECATVSLPTAAQILGIHRSTAWDLHKRGDFPVKVLRIGNRLRVPKAGLEAFLNSGQ